MTLSIRSYLTFAAVLCVIASGCGKNAPPPEGSSGQSPAGGAAVQASERHPGEPPADAAKPHPIEISSGADESKILQQLTSALRGYCISKRRMPASLEEVANAGFLQNIPPAPSGKKFAINSQTLQVVLENK